MERKYILNLESSKIELHFTKAEYDALPKDLKEELQRHFLWANSKKAWVSRSTKDHYWAIQTAKKLGFTEEERTGERLTYAEQLERKAERAEARGDRYLEYADNAEGRAESLQAEFNHFRGDIAFLTQPVIRGHAGSEAFARRRQRIMDRYDKGFQEYRKSQYFKDRAKTAMETADMVKLKSKSYLNNRIKECNASIRALEKNIINAEERENTEQEVEGYLERIEIEVDKLAFFENCLEELGGIGYGPDNIKPGYEVQINGSWRKVLKVNKVTVESQALGHLSMSILNYPYAKIQAVRVPDGWTEPKAVENPFSVGDIFAKYYIGSKSVREFFQAVKVTGKTVTIRKIEKDGNTPLKDKFVDVSREERKTIIFKRDEYYLIHDEWAIRKYEMGEEAKAVNG